MASTMRDELAALKIDRPEQLLAGRNGQGKSAGRRGGGGLRLLSGLLWLIPLGLLAGAGYFGYRQVEQLRARPEVTSELVRQTTMSEALSFLEAKGFLKSRYQAMIGAKLAGRVERMYVEEGMKVKKGSTLAVLEHNDLKALLASREARTVRTEAELQEARADLWEKEREEQRAIRLFAKRSITPEDHEKAIADCKKATARVAALEAGVKLMKANVEETKATIFTMSLYAPFDGTIVEKQGEEGEVITPMAMSSSLGRTAVVTVANLEKMDVETDVHEDLLWEIAVGQPAAIRVTAFPSRLYTGRLRRIIPMGDRARKTVKVKVEIVNPDEKLFPEIEAHVFFLPSSQTSAVVDDRTYLFVPKAAVFRENGRDYVWIIDEANAVHKRGVVVAEATEKLSRVESGLEKGEHVVVKPPGTLHEGVTVHTGQ